MLFRSPGTACATVLPQASFSWRASGVGAHKIRIVADPRNTIVEAREDNNEAVLSFEVDPGARPVRLLRIEPSVRPSHILEGDMAALYVVAEAESSVIPQNVAVIFLIDGTREMHASASIEPLARAADGSAVHSRANNGASHTVTLQK